MVMAGSDDIRDQVPDDVVARAKASFGRRSPGDVAVLVFDSLVDEGAPATDHRLRFEHPLMVIEVHVSAQADGSALEGRVEPALAERVEVQLDEAELSFVDQVTNGAFSFERLGHGPIRLRLTGQGIPAVHTDWFRI